MAEFQRINGYFGNFLADGLLKTTSDLKMFRLTLRSTSNGSNTAIDLQDKDGDTALTDADQLVELVIKELNPLLYQANAAATGVMYILVHGHNVDAAQIKVRLVGMSRGATIGSDTAVEAVTGITTVTV